MIGAHQPDGQFQHPEPEPILLVVFGGAGFDIALVFEELGRAGAVTPMLDTCILAGGLMADGGESALGLMNEVAHAPELEAQVRRAASGLYNASSAVMLAWESTQPARRSNRAGGARMLLARDPLAQAG